MSNFNIALAKKLALQLQKVTCCSCGSFDSLIYEDKHVLLLLLGGMLTFFFVFCFLPFVQTN